MASMPFIQFLTMEELWHLIKDFLFGKFNRQLLVFLFFLALSGAFWLLLALNETSEMEFRIPVKLIGVPDKVVITDGIDDTATVTIRDKGFTLFAYYYGNRLHPVRFKFLTYANSKTGHGQIPLSEVQKQIYLQLYGSSKISSLKVDRLDFYFNNGLSAMRTVKLDCEIHSSESYYLARYQFKPDKIKIYASQHLLDSISYLSTERIVFENFNDTVVRNVRLKPIRGVKMIPQSVRVVLYPDILTEYSIDVPVKPVNMPADKILRTFPGRIPVRFVVGASLVRSVRAEDFMIVADYDDIMRHPSDSKCNLYLKAAPHNISHVRLDINKVDYLIEQK